MSDVGPFVSYSINYEDVVLHRMFPGKARGFFVDVGAEHPRLGNDFFALYQRGWRGLNIEPNRAYFTQLVAERPDDQNLHLVLSDHAGQDLVFYVVEDTGLSTLDQAQAQAAAAKGFTVHERPVRTSTLGDVLGALNPPPIDVLKVDVEGAEEQVLRGNDWSRFRPALILVEVTYPQMPQRRPTQVRAELEAQGYRHILFDGLNDFFAEAGFAVPDGATLPPNVFDGFQRWDFVAVQADAADLRRYVGSLESEREALRDQATGLTAALAATERSHAALTAFQTQAEPERSLLTARLHAALAENDRLRSTVKDLRHEAGRLAAAHAQVHGEVMSLHRALEPAHAVGELLALLREWMDQQARDAGRLRAAADAQKVEMASRPSAPSPDPATVAQLQTAQQMLEAVHRSTSWRVTRPIRAVRRLVGRGS